MEVTEVDGMILSSPTHVALTYQTGEAYMYMYVGIDR